MKVFYVFLFLCFFNSVSYAEENKVSSEQQAIAAVNIFAQSCFFKRDRKQRLDFLNKKFTKHDKEKSEIFLNFTASKEGEVWGAVFPNAAYAIVVENNDNCHIIAEYADELTIHKRVKELYEASAKNLPDLKVSYNKLEESKLNSSGFEIMSPDGVTIAIVVASTKDDPKENKPAAVITLAVAP